MPRNSGSKMRTNSRHAGAHVPGSGGRPKAIKVHERRGRGHTHRSAGGRGGDSAAQLISRALGNR